VNTYPVQWKNGLAVLAALVALMTPLDLATKIIVGTVVVAYIVSDRWLKVQRETRAPLPPARGAKGQFVKRE
jgi:hypothetical protein